MFRNETVQKLFLATADPKRKGLQKMLTPLTDCRNTKETKAFFSRYIK